jgi:hypothetical protein
MSRLYRVLSARRSLVVGGRRPTPLGAGPRAKASSLALSESRSGTTIIELVVSFTLLMAVLGASLPLVVRHGRILTSARQYRIALDELSNQAERIASLGHSEANLALIELKCSAFASEHLPGAELTGVIAASEGIERVTLSLVWDEPGRRSAPLSLVAWLRPNAEPQPKSVEAAEVIP